MSNTTVTTHLIDCVVQGAHRLSKVYELTGTVDSSELECLYRDILVIGECKEHIALNTKDFQTFCIEMNEHNITFESYCDACNLSEEDLPYQVLDFFPDIHKSLVARDALESLAFIADREEPENALQMKKGLQVLFNSVGLLSEDQVNHVFHPQRLSPTE